MKKYITLKSILLFGLLIRLLLMPFFAHEDLTLTYGRAYSVVYEKANVFQYNEAFPHLIESANLILYDVFFDSDRLQPMSTDISENPNARLNMFFFKLPYLFFDIATFYLLMKMFKGSIHSKVALSFYFLNPILLFGVYTFGRYETFPVFFLVSTVYMLKKKNHNMASLMFSLAILSRISIILLLPVYLVSINIPLIKRIKHVIFAFGPYLLLSLVKVFAFNVVNEAKWVSGGHHVGFFFNAQLPIGYDEKLYLFFIPYFILLYYAFTQSSQIKEDWKSFTLYATVALALYYTLANFHPQYLVWILPFVTIGLLFNKWKSDIYWIYLGLIVALPFILITWGPNLYMGIFAPLSSEVATYDLLGKIGQYNNPMRIANLARTGLSSLYIILIVNQFRNWKLLGREKNEKVELF